MLDWNTLLAFSHSHCVAICSVLVPLNLLLTLVTFALVGFERPKVEIQQSTGLAIASALLMVLHVLTWLFVGVIRMQTFVLFSLGLCCLVLNLWAFLHTPSLRWFIHAVVQWASQTFRSMVQRVEAS